LYVQSKNVAAARNYLSKKYYHSTSLF